MLPTAVYLAGALLACTAVTAAGTPPPDAGAVGFVLDTEPVAFAVQLPEGFRVTAVVIGAETQQCPESTVFVSDDDERSFTITASHERCEFDNSEPLGNGRHGSYLTADDLPPDAVSYPEFHTGLGPATAHDVPYYECTNQCTDFVDAVVIVRRDDPHGAPYPTIVLQSPKSTVDSKALAAVAATLTAPM